MKALRIIPAFLLAFGLVSSERVAALDITAYFNEGPNGFVNQGVITQGLVAPIALGFLPDNRMLVLEKGGEILIADPESGQFHSYLNISNRVDSGQERGLLEIAIPPDFDPLAPGRNLIYLYYTRAAGTNRAVIASFEHQERAGGLSSTANANSEVILWTDTDGLSSCCHYGGGLDFGPDGKIWLTSADKFTATNVGETFAGGTDDSADLTSTSGKIIRINIDGSIPNGNDGWPANPYYDAGDSLARGDNFDPYPVGQTGLNKAHQSIWAYGLRNPFRADWDLENELFYIGEVGGNQATSRDDVHLGSLDQAGVFYGWNFYEGVNNVQVSAANTRVFNPGDFPPRDPDLGDPFTGDYFSAPIYDIPHSSLTGGFVYRGAMFPDAFDGVYFFGNYEHNYIKFLDLDPGGTVARNVYDFKPSSKIAGAVNSIVFLEEGVDGALYYVNYSANGGQVQRIVYRGNDAPSIDNVTVTDNRGDPGDATGAEPLTVTFNATVSDTDSAMNQLRYTLSFGDATPNVTGTPSAAGAISVQHTYAVEGFYSASLSLSDGNKSTLSPPLSITVGDPNDPPEIVSAVSDVFFGEPGLLVTFTATVTDPDADDPAPSLTYSWDFGDGTPNATGSPDADGVITVQHTYNAKGEHNASVKISDGEAPTVRSHDISIQVGVSSELPVVDGLVFQAESFIKVGTNGTTVTEWLDESGFGNNLAAAGNPQYVPNATPSRLPAIVLDGNGDYLARTSALGGFPAGAGARTMFFVVDYADVTNNEYAGLVYGSPEPNQGFGLILNGNDDDLTIQGWGGANDQHTNVDGVINPAGGGQRGFISHAVVLQANGAFTHYLNGNVIASGSHTFATSLEKLLIGQNLDGGETPMSVAAAFIYDRALTANEFDAVEAYIQSTYLTVVVDTPPQAGADFYFATSGQPLTVPVSTGLLANDTDDGPLTLVAINGRPVADGATVSLANAALTIEDDGAFTYTPAPGFTGTQSFAYTVTDRSQSDSATVTIDVTVPGGVPVIDALVAQLEADSNVIEADGVVTEWLSGAGTNMDLVASGDPQLVRGATPNGQAAIRLDGGLAAFGEAGATEGDKLQRSAPQILNDLPGANTPRSIYFVVDYKASNGVFAGVTYGKGAANAAFGLVSDGDDDNLAVHGWGGGNDFIAQGQSGIGDNDGSTGDDWFVHSARFDGTTIRHYRDHQLIGTGSHSFATIVEKFVIGEEIAGSGFAALDVAAVLVYDKALSDREHARTIEFLTRKFFLPNTDPVAVDDPDAGNAAAFTTDQNTAFITGSVLGNDSDPDTGDGLLVSSIDTTGTLGSVVNNHSTFGYDPNGAFAYLSEGERATDTFSYTVSDSRGGSDTATVTITIEGAVSDVLVRLPFDEGIGDVAADASGKNNDGTLLNGAGFVADTPNGSAFALSLDGIDDVVDLGVLDAVGSGLTLATWFKVDTFSGATVEPRLISKATSTLANDHVFMLSTTRSGAANRLRGRLRIGGTTTTLVADAGDIVAGVWRHAALTHDGTTMRLYLDGIEVGSAAVPGAVDQAPTVPVALGGQPAGAGDRSLKGMLDDVFIAQRALRASEITALTAALSLQASSSTTSYGAPGEVIDYNYLVSNTGVVTLDGPIIIADSGSGTRAICDLSTVGNGDPRLDVGEAVSCAASYAVTQADIDAGSIHSVVRAHASGTTSNRDELTLNFVQSLTLVTSSATVSYSAVGDLIDYSYLVTNTGDVALAGPLAITDDRNGSGAICDLGAVGNLDATLDVGETVRCSASYAVSQADIDAGSVTNVASASADGKTSNNDGLTVNAVQTPSLTLLASSARSSYEAVGELIDYRYSVTNTGNVTLSGPVTISDDTPTAGCEQLTTVGNLDARLDVGETLLCTASHTVTQADVDAGTVHNLVSASAGGVTSDALGVTVNAARLTLVTSSATASYDAVGALIDYGYLVTNTGNVALAGPLTIADDRTASSALCDLAAVGNRDSNFDVGEAVFCSASYAVTQADIDAGSVTNLATASAGGTTSNSDGVRVNFVAALTLVTSSPTTSYDAVGELIDYTYLVTNTGNRSLAGPVTITDDRTGNSAICDLGAVGNGDANLDVGEALSCTATYAVTRADLDARSVANVATASADGRRSNTDGVRIGFAQVLTLAISSPTRSYNAVGAIIEYDYSVSNSGTVALAGPVTIADDRTGTSAVCDLAAVGNRDGNLDVGEAVSCSASYAVTQADIDTGSVTNVASASADGKISNDDGVTVIAVQPVPGALVQLPFEEGGGSVTADISGNGNDGTLLHGAAFSADTANGSESALVLDGSDDIVDLGTLDVNGSGLTLAAWIKARTFPGINRDPRLISKATGVNSSEHVFMLSTIASGAATRLRARVRVGGATTTLIASSGNLTTGVWTHAALTHDGTNLRLFLNGTEVGSTTLVGTLDQAPTVPVAVGGQPSGAGPRYFDGLLDDVLIARRALSAAEIGALFTGVPTPRLALVTSSATTRYESSGDLIDYSYSVANTGNVSLAGPITISDDRGDTGAICNLGTAGNGDANLDVDETVLCHASYAVTRADVDAGAVTRVARARAGGATSNGDGVTVKLAQLTLATSSATASFDAPGELIDYGYAVSNSGGVALAGPVTITDDKTGTSAICDLSAVGNGDTHLDVGEVLLCAASYAVTQADIDAGAVTNVASASADGVNSNADGVTVNAAGLTLVTSSPTTSYGAVGELIDYGYTVTNTGNVPFDGPVIITDDRTGTSAVCDLGAAGNGDATLDVGEAVECTAVYTVTRADIDAGAVTNVASASANGTSSSNDGVTVNFVQSLTLVTSSPTTRYDAPGELIDYGYRVTNTGEVTLAGPVTITDDRSGTSAICDLSAVGNGDANLDVGETVSCSASYAVTEADIDAGSVTNLARASADGKRSNNDGVTVYLAQLRLVTSSAVASYGAVGESIGYRYAVSNSGGVTLAGPVTITDDHTGTSAICDLGAVGNGDAILDVGEVVICTAVYAVTQADIDAGSVTNLARASADGTNSDDDGVTIHLARLTLVTSSPTARFDAPGDLIDYTYTVTNSGGVTLAGPVTIADDRIGTSALCDLGAVGNLDAMLDAGETVSCSASYAVTGADIDAGSVTNLAVASAGGANSNSDGVTINVARLTLLISSPTTRYGSIGELIDYSYSVTNSGGVPLAGPVTITDDHTGTGAICDLSAVGNLDAVLDVGETVSCSAGYAVTQADIDAGAVVNLASASADGTTSNDDGVTVELARLTLVTSSPTTRYGSIGEPIDYSYSVTNSGAVTLAGPVTITDDRTGTGAVCDLGAVGNGDASLDAGEVVICSASYAVTQADIDAGSVTNAASASADGTTSNSDGVTVNAVQAIAGALLQLPFEDGAGEVARDVSGNDNDGALRNGAAFTADTPNGSAFALALDGMNDFVDLGALDVDGNGLTLAAWFKADSFTGTYRDSRLISKATGTSANEHVFMLSTFAVGSATRLRARLRVGGTVTTLFASSGDLALGVWQHAALTHDGATARLYLNGLEVGSTPLPGAVDQVPGMSVAAGGQPSGAGSRFFDGLLDDVLIAQRALSAPEISELAGAANE